MPGAIPAIIMIGATLKIAQWGLAYNAQQQALQHNIEMAKEDAATVREWSKIEAEEFAEEGEKLKGTQRAVVGGSAAKLTEGSPLYIMQETKAKLEEDRRRIIKEGEKVAGGYEKEAGYYQKVSGQLPYASLLGLGSSLFSQLAMYGFSKQSPMKKPMSIGTDPYRFSPYG